MIRFGFALSLLLATPAIADDDAGWPCEQVRQGELSHGAMWGGPDLVAPDWRSMPDVAALVAEIAPRRVKVEDAQARIEGFAHSLAEAERSAKLTALFAGLFDHIGRERHEILNGIGHYDRRQNALARRIEQGWAKLDSGQVSAPDQMAAIRQQVEWDSRVFDERQKLLPQICEQPGLLERRIFTLARTIAAALP